MLVYSDCLVVHSEIGVDAKQKLLGQKDKQTKFFTFHINYWDRQTDKFLYVSHQLLEHSNRRKREKYILCDGFCDIRITNFLQV